MTDSYIVTYSGRRFHYSEPRPEDVSLEDVALALSNICRYGGHTFRFYSVAQHSVLVSRWCDPEDALAGLLHDASEAYLWDCPSPLKRVPEMEGYLELEARVQPAVARALGASGAIPPSVLRADERVYLAEVRDILPREQYAVRARQSGGTTPVPEHIVPLPPEAARAAFLARYAELRLS